MKKYKPYTLSILALMALATVLATVLAWQLDRAVQEEIVTQFSQRQLHLAEQTATSVQRVFDEARRDLMHFKKSACILNFIAALDAGDEKEIAARHETLKEAYLDILNTHPIYAQVRYLDREGQEIVGADSDGEVVRIIPADELRSQAERDFFIKTMALGPGEVYVSPLEPALGHGQFGKGLPTVRMATPVFDEQGYRRGIVAINLFTDYLLESVFQIGSQEGMEAWILDKHGIEIVNVTHPERVGSNAYEYCRESDDENLIRVAEEMLAGHSGAEVYFWFEQNGSSLTQKVLAYAPVHLDDQLWTLGISVPYSDVVAAHAKARSSLLYMLGVIVSSTLVSGVLLLRLERRRILAEEKAKSAEVFESRNRELAVLNTLAEKRAAQMMLANEVGQLALSILNLDEMMHQVARAIQTGFDYYNVALFLVDESHREAVLRAVAGGFEGIVPHPYRQSMEEGIIGWVTKTGQQTLSR
ncbi:MAG: cache domain-containing protein, partial [Chloroflexota bacterium]|nr:cache domain-containing protein [Chloroflexota bacterium]